MQAFTAICIFDRGGEKLFQAQLKWLPETVSELSAGLASSADSPVLHSLDTHTAPQPSPRISWVG